MESEQKHFIKIKYKYAIALLVSGARRCTVIHTQYFLSEFIILCRSYVVV